jgi:hypothetical protein
VEGRKGRALSVRRSSSSAFLRLATHIGHVAQFQQRSYEQLQKLSVSWSAVLPHGELAFHAKPLSARVHLCCSPSIRCISAYMTAQTVFNVQCPRDHQLRHTITD